MGGATRNPSKLSVFHDGLRVAPPILR